MEITHFGEAAWAIAGSQRMLAEGDKGDTLHIARKRTGTLFQKILIINLKNISEIKKKKKVNGVDKSPFF